MTDRQELEKLQRKGTVRRSRGAPQALAAAPAVGGEDLRQALTNWFHSLPTDFLSNPKKCNAEFAALMRCIPAAQPASPLRGSLTKDQLADIVDRAWKNNGEVPFPLYLRELESIASDIFAALSSSAPTEQPGAARSGMDQIKRGMEKYQHTQPQFLSGCLHPGDHPEGCQRKGSCQSMACKHAGKAGFWR